MRTGRALEALKLLGKGLSTKEIAYEMGIHRKTAEYHIRYWAIIFNCSFRKLAIIASHLTK